ncbi:hypothetical protein C8Q77DRAFT_358563 [Trametes polyzona]|nr:hypothetical protein C8Q77DRAFT_358563 [Trametes polyzona]
MSSDCAHAHAYVRVLSLAVLLGRRCACRMRALPGERELSRFAAPILRTRSMQRQDATSDSRRRRPSRQPRCVPGCASLVVCRKSQHSRSATSRPCLQFVSGARAIRRQRERSSLKLHSHGARVWRMSRPFVALCHSATVNVTTLIRQRSALGERMKRCTLNDEMTSAQFEPNGTTCRRWRTGAGGRLRDRPR